MTGTNTEHQIAVPTETQQQAALYGIGSVITGFNIPNKKKIKKIVKKARASVITDMGREAGKEILDGNRETVSQYLQCIANDHRLTSDPKQAKVVRGLCIQNLLKSFNIGAGLAQ